MHKSSYRYLLQNCGLSFSYTKTFLLLYKSMYWQSSIENLCKNCIRATWCTKTLMVARKNLWTGGWCIERDLRLVLEKRCHVKIPWWQQIMLLNCIGFPSLLSYPNWHNLKVKQGLAPCPTPVPFLLQGFAKEFNTLLVSGAFWVVLWKDNIQICSEWFPVDNSHIAFKLTGPEATCLRDSWILV